MSTAISPASTIWERDVRPWQPGGEAVALIGVVEAEHTMLEEVASALRDMGITCGVGAASAYHGLEGLERSAREAAARGTRLIVAAAGKEPSLPGLVAAWSGLPVLAVPLASESAGGVEALVAAVQVPDGAPVAVVAAEGRGARAVVWLAAAILALADPVVAGRYRDARANLATSRPQSGSAPETRP